MKKKWRATLFVLAIALICAVSGASALAVADSVGIKTNTTVVQQTWSDAAIQATYNYRDVFTIPTRTVTVEDHEAEATATLEFPDGTVTRQTQVRLDQTGKYTLRYTAAIENKSYFDTITFTVVEGLYSFEDDDSSAEYGIYGGKLSNGGAAAGSSGLLVSLAEGDTFTINAPIDVRNADMNTPLVEGFATPAVMGEADFSRLIFTFIDIEDPSNYLRVSCRESSDSVYADTSYYLAGGNGQALTGYEESLDRLHVDNEWGTPSQHSFSGKIGGNTSTPLDTVKFSIRYDNATNSVYVGDKMIVDLDNPKFFDTLWMGFKSGYVRLCIEADLYQGGNNADFCLTEVLGVDLRQKEPEALDPVITIDTEYSEDDMPAALVGTAYPVPTATAFDRVCGNSDVSVTVYYGNSPTTAGIRNGAFTPERAGTYYIVYETENYRGKTDREVLRVDAYDALPDMTITSEQIGGEQTVYLGQAFTVTEPEVMNASGKAVIETSVTFGGQTTVIQDKFTPEEAGTYIVEIKATDYIGRTQKASISVTASTDSNNPAVFVDEPQLPQYLIDGGTYIVPEYYAIDYSSGKAVHIIATMQLDGETYHAGDKFVPEIENQGDMLTVTFVAGSARKEVTRMGVKAFIYGGDPARDRLHMENYFIGDGINAQTSDNGIVITATAADGAFTFANELVAENFEIEFIGIADKSRFDRLDICMTDIHDPTVSVTMHIIDNGEDATIFAGGGFAGIDYSFTTGGTFNISYASKMFTIGLSEIAITTCDNDDAFDGFPSGKFMLRMAFVGADTAGNAAYRLSKINNQPMSNSTSDRITPKVSVLSRDYGGFIALNAEKEIPAAMAGDTLDPYTVFTLTVTDPNGDIVTAVDGTRLENVDPTRAYTIVGKLYGQYNVSYTASDTFNGTPTVWSYVITVEDRTAPEIHVGDGFKTTAKVGDVLCLPTITATDNLSDADNIRITKFVLNPNGDLIMLTGASNSIRCAYAGQYQFRIVAVDEAGNMTTVYLTVTVTE